MKKTHGDEFKVKNLWCPLLKLTLYRNRTSHRLEIKASWVKANIEKEKK